MGNSLQKLTPGEFCSSPSLSYMKNLLRMSYVLGQAESDNWTVVLASFYLRACRGWNHRTVYGGGAVEDFFENAK